MYKIVLSQWLCSWFQGVASSVIEQRLWKFPWRYIFLTTQTLFPLKKRVLCIMYTIHMFFFTFIVFLPVKNTHTWYICVRLRPKVSTFMYLQLRYWWKLFMIQSVQILWSLSVHILIFFRNPNVDRKRKFILYTKSRWNLMRNLTIFFLLWKGLTFFFYSMQALLPVMIIVV